MVVDSFVAKEFVEGSNALEPWGHGFTLKMRSDFD